MLLEALDAHRLLENGVSLADQGHTDSHGEAPALLLDWLPHVAAVVHEVRAEKQVEAAKKAQAEAARNR
jgi:hypothetical protein